VFWVPLVAGLQGWATRPLFKVSWGDTPLSPRHGGFAPLPPLSHPRGLRVCRRFGVLTSPPAENPAKFSPFPRRKGGQEVRSEDTPLRLSNGNINRKV